MADNNLPGLPPSDSASLLQNRTDSFYQVKPKDFWQHNQVSHSEVKPFQKCAHFFERVEQDIRCMKCKLGITGNFTIENGVLLYQGKPVFS